MTKDDQSFFARYGSFERSAPGAEAIGAYERLLRRTPDLPDVWYEFARALKAVGRYEAALAAFEEALRRGAHLPEEIHLNRAVILADCLRREDAAEAELREALSVRPGYVPALLNLGRLREDIGDSAGAAAVYDQILPPTDNSAPAHLDLRFEALARLAHLQPPTTLSDPFLQRLEEAARSPRLLPPETRANLYYALGRTLDAFGAYDDAFAAYSDANRIVRKAGPPYRREVITDAVNRLIDAFPAASPPRDSADETPRPVFICGMFRSGSTLVEQVLAAHPAVFAGGELNLLSEIVDRDLAPFPEAARRMTDAAAEALAARYRRELVRLFPASKTPGAVVTDKRPDNFLRIGLIKRLFPKAKIVHTVRHPVDTCLSVYFQHIDQAVVGYASDLADAGHYYGCYQRMMAHWKSLYAADILDFDYDRFVVAPEEKATALLEFLGLPWDSRCLEFHAQKNPVKTASYWQVRKPLYRDSSGRRRNYAAHIDPLLRELSAAGVEVGDTTLSAEDER